MKLHGMSVIFKNRMKIYAFLLLTTLYSANSYGVINPFSVLEDLIKKNSITNIEDLLKILQPGQDDNYAIVFNSRSLQTSTPVNPRVLVYSLNGKFIYSFNGDPTKAQYDAIEAMWFNDDTKEFEFKELKFPAQTFTAPPSCASCHKVPARPIWDTKPMWPGVYGQLYQQDLTVDERNDLAKFLDNRKTHARYSQLVNIDKFNAAVTNTPGTVSPNATLSQLLTSFNLDKIVHDIQQASNFNQFKYLLLAALDKTCNVSANYQSYLPDTMQDQGQFMSNYDTFKKHTDTQNVDQNESKLYRLVPDKTAAPKLPDGPQTLSDFRYVVEEGLRIKTLDSTSVPAKEVEVPVKTTNWTLAAEKDTYDFTSLQDVEEELRTKLTNAIGFINTTGDYCGNLQTQSRTSLANYPYVYKKLVYTDRNLDQLLEVCSSCHTTGVGPQIDFKTPDLLGAELDKTSPSYHILNDAGTFSTDPNATLIDEIQYRISLSPKAPKPMPQGQAPLTPGEIEELMNYLESVKD